MHYSSEREGERERQLGQQMLQMMMQNVGQNQNTSDSQVKQMMQTLQQEFAFQIDKQEKHHQSDSYPHSDSAIPSLLPERRPSSQTYPSASSYPSDYAREEAVYQEQSYQGSKYPNPELQQPQRQSRLVDLPSKYPSYESQQPQTLSSLSDRSSSIPPLMSNPQQSDQSGVHRLLNSLEDKLRFGNLDANQAIQVRLLHGKISQIASTPQQDHNVGGRSAGIPSLLDGSSRMMDRQNGSQSGYNQYALMGDSRDSLQSGYNLEASRFAEPMPSSLGRMDSFHDYGYSMNREPTRAVDHSWYSSNSSRTSQQAYKPEQRNRRYSDVVDGHTIRRLDGNRWRCLVCQTSFSVWNDVVSHADGALHAANKHHAQKRSLERRSSGGRGLDSYSDRKRSGSPQYGGAKRAKLTYCSICKVDCNTEKSYQEHLKGKKHALSIETIMETSKKSAPSKSNKFNKKSQSSSEKKAKTYCDTCDVECHQEKSLAIHLKTSNHQRKVKEIKNDKMSAANKAHVASMFEMSIACGFGRSDKITTVEELMAYKKRITVADKLAKTFKSTDTPDADLCLICARKITKKEQDAHCKLDHHMNNIESFEKLTKWLNLFTLIVDPNKCTEAFKEIDSLEKSLKSVGKPPCPFCTLKNKNVKPDARQHSKHVLSCKHVSFVRVVQAIVDIGKAVKQKNGQEVLSIIQKYENLLFATDLKPLAERCELCEKTAFQDHNLQFYHNYNRYYLEALVISFQPLKLVDFMNSATSEKVSEKVETKDAAVATKNGDEKALEDSKASVDKSDTDEKDDITTQESAELIEDNVKKESDAENKDEAVSADKRQKFFSDAEFSELKSKFDREKATGQEFIVPCFYCILCEKYVLDPTEAYNEHCQTTRHYRGAEDAVKNKPKAMPKGTQPGRGPRNRGKFRRGGGRKGGR